MCLYAQLVQTKNKQCKSAIILQCYHPHLSDFCSRSRLTQPIIFISISIISVSIVILLFFIDIVIIVYFLCCCPCWRNKLHIYNISWCCQNLSSLLLKVSVVSADITISGKLFHTFTILDATENFLKS